MILEIKTYYDEPHSPRDEAEERFVVKIWLRTPCFASAHLWLSFLFANGLGKADRVWKQLGSLRCLERLGTTWLLGERLWKENCRKCLLPASFNLLHLPTRLGQHLHLLNAFRVNFIFRRCEYGLKLPSGECR